MNGAYLMLKTVMPVHAYLDVGGRATHDCMDAGGRNASGTAFEEPKPKPASSIIKSTFRAHYQLGPGLRQEPWIAAGVYARRLAAAMTVITKLPFNALVNL